ncbi:MAG TPA: hypothetical protein PK411_10105 [Mesotoga infera]|nr:hypothetical protein [Mesotoga sp.]HOI35056.1 hypothetical protein [Mesotoga infera]HON28730.1 hypothetical protein [Mesotoga infera]HPD38679.1 hypothetical protein [Mesotoga infera]HRV02052.1 hypothetical protein [Mesotoga sp.]
MIRRLSQAHALPGRGGGFSFVEVLIALLIIIISVVALLNFLTASLRVNDTSSKIAGDLLVSSGELETGDIEGVTATITVNGVSISGKLRESPYGSSKKLVEFVRSSGD